VVGELVVGERVVVGELVVGELVVGELVVGERVVVVVVDAIAGVDTDNEELMLVPRPSVQVEGGFNKFEVIALRHDDAEQY